MIDSSEYCPNPISTPGNRIGRRGGWLRASMFVAVMILVPGGYVVAGENFNVQRFTGDYVLSLHGSFKSAPPPFTGDVLKLDAALIGRYSLGADGLVEGQHIVTFSNAEVPFNPRSAFNATGEFSVEPDGLLTMIIEEDRFEPGVADGQVDGQFIVECYIVTRGQAQCLMHTITSFAQGPAPVLLPTTMSGKLQHQP